MIAQLEKQRPSITDEIKCYNPRNVDTGEQTRMQDRVYDVEGSTVVLTAFCDRMNIIEPKMIGQVDIKGHDAIKRVYATEGISPTLTTMGGGHREPKRAVVGNLKPEGCTCQGQRDDVYSDDGLIGALNATDYKQSRMVAQEICPVLTPDCMKKRQNGRRFKENDEPTFTLTAQDRHGVAIRETTKQRYAIVEVGESINVQFPNSKTRRGRIGKGVAQTLETSCNQATLVEGKGCLDGEEKERNTVEVLREEVGGEAIAKWRFRVLDLFQSAQILRQGVYEEGVSREGDYRRSELVHSTQASEKSERSGKRRDVWINGECRYTPQGRELEEQFTRELTGIMQKLSHERASSEESMYHLWEAAQGSQLLQQALHQIQEIRRSDV
ncbi:hypothetical protein [Bacillus cereus]|uniref:hypothetical protein n=1 Tax=Bacillus cereus TaxID=1396 RepID=UPI0038732E1E